MEIPTQLELPDLGFAPTGLKIIFSQKQNMINKVIFSQTDNCYVFNCPHCDNLIQVEKNQVNCKIFRHGQYKNNGEQLPPHSPKQLCDELSASGAIHGCGKPFKLIPDEQGIITTVEICDYI